MRGFMKAWVLASVGVFLGELVYPPIVEALNIDTSGDNLGADDFVHAFTVGGTVVMVSKVIR